VSSEFVSAERSVRGPTSRQHAQSGSEDGPHQQSGLVQDGEGGQADAAEGACEPPHALDDGQGGPLHFQVGGQHGPLAAGKVGVPDGKRHLRWKDSVRLP
jgi:hypothetical protein